MILNLINSAKYNFYFNLNYSRNSLSQKHFFMMSFKNSTISRSSHNICFFSISFPIFKYSFLQLNRILSLCCKQSLVFIFSIKRGGSFRNQWFPSFFKVSFANKILLVPLFSHFLYSYKFIVDFSLTLFWLFVSRIFQ